MNTRMKNIEIDIVEELPFKEHVPFVNLIVHGPHQDDKGYYYVGAASTMESYSGEEGHIGDFLGKFYADREVVIESHDELTERDAQLIANAINDIIWTDG